MVNWFVVSIILAQKHRPEELSLTFTAASDVKVVQKRAKITFRFQKKTPKSLELDEETLADVDRYLGPHRLDAVHDFLLVSNQSHA